MSGTDLIVVSEMLIVVSEMLTPAVVFRDGGVRSILDSIKAEVAKVEIDISTPKGRKDCASLAYKIARSKTALDKMGKDLTDQWRAQAEAVHAERRTITKELDALAAEVRGPLTEWENAETARIRAHEDAIAEINQQTCVWSADVPGISEIEAHIARVEALSGERDWQEFRKRASDTAAKSLDVLRSMLSGAQRLAEERAEAARVEAERVEAERLQAIREQQAREARIAAEAAEAARRDAEEIAAQQAKKAADAAEAERQKLVREAEEQREAAARAERERVAAEARTAREKQEAAEAAERAERQRQADADAAAKREAKAREEAAAAERRRQEQEAQAARAAAEARERNVAHRRKINREAAAALVTAMAGAYSGNATEAEKIAIAIVTAIAKREVPHVAIAY